MSRFCKCGCGESLDGLRVDALYHSPACRMRAKRAASPNKGRTRRPSRDGKGVKIYVAPTDHVYEVWQKVKAARDRRAV